jgi:sialate O-acetylesterase
MAVTIDLGDPKVLHPPYKEPVAHRLALAAEEQVYGEKILGTSPLFVSATPDGGKLTVKFKNVGTGLKIGQSPVTPPGATPLPTTELKGFAVAGADGKYSWAKATITGPDTVSVSADGVASPVYVRYAWNPSPEANLYNSADLPASPFRTDSAGAPNAEPPKKPEAKPAEEKKS